MKIRLAAHLTCAAVCLGLLFADQGRLASVLYFLYLGVEVFISASSATMASGEGVSLGGRAPYRLPHHAHRLNPGSQPEQGNIFQKPLAK